MSSAVARRPRHLSVIRAVAIAGLLGAMPGIGLAHAASAASHRTNCPAAESLIPGTTFTHHTLAKGVTIAAGTAKDAAGSVNIHVLRVDLTRPRVHVVPLVHSLANREPLTNLAAHRKHLVAATNTGYFDFVFGAPTDPLIVNSAPWMLTEKHQPVVGIDKFGRIEAGDVWSQATVIANKSTRPLVAVNDVYPPNGISVFNGLWGVSRVPGGWTAQSRSVKGSAISGGTVRHGATVPSSGYLLHSRGRAASDWLSGLPNGSKVTVASRVRTTAASPFVQAFGVGLQLVAKGVATTGFTCDSANTKTPARTAIGWTHGGRRMVIALVTDHPYTPVHGLDQDEMSKLMAQLGVDQAWSFDGSGSTELLAKLKHSKSLTMQTYPADGAERPMPVGLGISVSPAKHKHH